MVLAQSPMQRVDYRRPMRRVSGTGFIPASPADVYAFLAEPTNLPRWQEGVVSSERTSPPPTVAGSTGRVVIEMMGQRVTADHVHGRVEQEQVARATGIDDPGLLEHRKQFGGVVEGGPTRLACRAPSAGPYSPANPFSRRRDGFHDPHVYAD